MDSSTISNSELQQSLIATCKFLDSQHIRYALTGGMALAVWGQPRSTVDVDLIVAISPEDLPTFITQMNASAHFLLEPDELQFPHMTIYRGHLQGKQPDVLITVDIILLDREWTESLMNRRHSITLYGHTVWVSSSEDIILLKLFSQRGKDLDDIRGICVQRGQLLDKHYIEQWADKLGINDAWKQIKI